MIQMKQWIKKGMFIQIFGCRVAALTKCLTNDTQSDSEIDDINNLSEGNDPADGER